MLYHVSSVESSLAVCFLIHNPLFSSVTKCFLIDNFTVDIHGGLIFFSLKGLIDYNFHCFRKAVHEVFEVGVASHRSCGHQTSAPSLKALTHNGTPRNAI